MSLFSSIGSAIGSIFGSSSGGSSWGSIIGTGLKVGSSLLSASANNKAANAQYQADIATSKSQLIQSAATLRAAAAQQQEGVYKQIEYNRLAAEQQENASRALTTAAQKAYLIRRAGRETAENALAGYAASGVVSGSGTAGYVPAYIVGRAEEDAFSAFQEGKDTAAQYTKQANAYVTAGNQARSASDTAAAGTREQAKALEDLAGVTASVAGQTKSASNTANMANLLGSAANIASGWFS